MSVNRRQLLTLTGTALAGTVAGCSEADRDDDNGTPEPTPTPDNDDNGSTNGDDDGGENTPEEPREITGNDYFDVEYRIDSTEDCTVSSLQTFKSYDSETQQIFISTGFNGNECEELRVVNGEHDEETDTFIIDVEFLPTGGDDCDEGCYKGNRLDIEFTFLKDEPFGFIMYLTTEDGRKEEDGAVIDHL